MKQSDKSEKIIRLPRSLRSLAMTIQDYDTISFGGERRVRGKISNIFGYPLSFPFRTGDAEQPPGPPFL